MKKNSKNKFIAVILSLAMGLCPLLQGMPVLATEQEGLVNQLNAAATMTAGGWNESLYAEISGVTEDAITGVSYSGEMHGSLDGDDLEYLVRN